jgi:exosome complex component RRP45
LTFAFFHEPSCPPILDPTYLEQRLSAGLLSIALNAQREMCVLHKAGGVPLAPEKILDIIGVAVIKARELDALVESRLREDWEGRKVEIR